MRPHSPFYRAEARHYVERLNALIEIPASARVLDFGCGLGFIAAALAAQVREIWLWDALATMRERAMATTAACPNRRMLEVWPPPAAAEARFDLVLVNSVLQYLGDEAAAATLLAFRLVLTPQGSVVVSDLVDERASIVGEAAELVAFALRAGVLPAAVRESVPLIRQRLRAAQAGHYVRRQRSDIEALARGAGLSLQWLPKSLTPRERRATALLRPAGLTATVASV